MSGERSKVTIVGRVLLCALALTLAAGCWRPAGIGVAGNYNDAILELGKNRKGGEVNKAIVHLEYVVRKDPRYRDGLTQLGRAYYYAGRYQAAFEVLKRALVVNEKDEIGWIVMGLAQFRQGDDEKGVAELQGRLDSAGQGYGRRVQGLHSGVLGLPGRGETIVAAEHLAGAERRHRKVQDTRGGRGPAAPHRPRALRSRAGPRQLRVPGQPEKPRQGPIGVVRVRDDGPNVIPNPAAAIPDAPIERPASCHAPLPLLGRPRHALHHPLEGSGRPLYGEVLCSLLQCSSVRRLIQDLVHGHGKCGIVADRDERPIFPVLKNFSGTGRTVRADTGAAAGQGFGENHRKSFIPRRHYKQGRTRHEPIRILYVTGEGYSVCEVHPPNQVLKFPPLPSHAKDDQTA